MKSLHRTIIGSVLFIILIVFSLKSVTDYIDIDFSGGNSITGNPIKVTIRNSVASASKMKFADVGKDTYIIFSNGTIVGDGTKITYGPIFNAIKSKLLETTLQHPKVVTPVSPQKISPRQFHIPEIRSFQRLRHELACCPSAMSTTRLIQNCRTEGR